MIEKKGPFDSAINCLTVMADRDFANGAPHRGAFRAAIKVIEAAGKVDKRELIDGLEELWNVYVYDYGAYRDMKKIVGDIDALLESLPELEEECK